MTPREEFIDKKIYEVAMVSIHDLPIDMSKKWEMMLAMKEAIYNAIDSVKKTTLILQGATCSPQ
jgi:hypothetical protein